MYVLGALARGQSPVIQNSSIVLPEKPGLGVTLNEEVARHYVGPGEPFFQ